jgi:hypothetical protein
MCALHAELTFGSGLATKRVAGKSVDSCEMVRLVRSYVAILQEAMSLVITTSNLRVTGCLSVYLSICLYLAPKEHSMLRVQVCRRRLV